MQPCDYVLVLGYGAEQYQQYHVGQRDRLVVVAQGSGRMV